MSNTAQELREWAAEEQAQGLARQGGIDFMLKYTRGEAEKVAESIKGFAEEVGTLNKNESISAKYRDEKIEEKRALIDSRFDLMIQRCEDKIQRAVNAAEADAALPVIPAAEMQVVALTAVQDVEARTPEQWFELYEETARAGDRVKLSHLRRLLDPRMAEHPAAWEMRKMKYRTPEEITRDETLAAAESLRAGVLMLRNVYFPGYLRDVKNVPDFVELSAVLDEMEDHTRRAASEVSATWKALNA